MNAKNRRLYRFAKYCWHKFRLRHLYQAYSFCVKGLGFRQRIWFYQNVFFFRRYLDRRDVARSLADSPPGTEDFTEKMRVAPGYDVVDFDKIKPISGISPKYYEPGTFNLRGQTNKAKIGMTFNRASWHHAAVAADNGQTTDQATDHANCCLAVPIVTGRSFALHLFHVFTCFLYLRNLKRQGYEVECLLLDGKRDKSSGLYTACLPDCRFPEDFHGVHRFRRVLFAEQNQRGQGWGGMGWRQILHTCGLGGDFHRFVLRAFDLPPPEPTRRVTTITVIRRKKHVAEGGKPCIDRVVRNEEEVMDALIGRYPTLEVQGVYFEELPLREQFRRFARSDLTLGMHGAGLIAAAYFSPPNAGLLELFPKHYRIPESALTCPLIASDRKLHYQYWINHRRANEFGTDVQPGLPRDERYKRTPIRYASSTQVPIRALTKRIDRLRRAIESTR